MATNLFDKYFDNPTKSYIYTSMVCNGKSADEISFDILKSAGVISDNVNTLSELDLSEVHVPLTQYDKGMKTIEPYSFIYLKGSTTEKGYTRKVYMKINDEILSIDNWQEHLRIYFTFKFVINGQIARINVDKTGTEDEPVIDQIQSIFDEAGIPVTVSIMDDFKIAFTASELGYEFWIDSVTIDYTMVNDSDDEEEKICVLGETLVHYVPAYKYKNGGLKGCVIYAEYPEFNADSIPETQHSLRIAHLRDRTYVTFPTDSKSFNGYPVCMRMLFDVDDTYSSEREKILFGMWSNGSININGNVVVLEDDKWQEAFVGKRPINRMGLYGFLNHVAHYGEWEPMGQFYAQTTAADDPSSPANNLLNSIIVYNPNPFPVIANYIIFA